MFPLLAFEDHRESLPAGEERNAQLR